MTVGEGVDKAIGSVLVGLGNIAHRVLSLRPARVEADLRAYLAMRSLADEAALVADEAEREVYEPDELWCAARVREQEENFGRAQHPLYRQLQDQVSAPVSHSPEPVVADGPGVAPPKPATPGQPPKAFRWSEREGLTPVSPAGTGAQAGTGGSPTLSKAFREWLEQVPEAESADKATSALLYAASVQLSHWQDRLILSKSVAENEHIKYLAELIPELRDRAAQFEAHDD